MLGWQLVHPSSRSVETAMDIPLFSSCSFRRMRGAQRLFHKKT